jgi:hypothetical protein
LGIFLLAFLAMLVISGKNAVAQSVSLFDNSVPDNPAEADYAAVTLGVKFWSTQPGTISAITFYRGTASPGGYVARLYSASGDVLGEVTMPQESDPVPGWQTATFSTPISSSPKKTYIAAYYAPSGQHADDYYGLRHGVTTGPLAAPASWTVGGNGVYFYGNGFPQSTWEASNYFVDVLSTSTVATPYLKLSVDPDLKLSVDPASPSITSDTQLGSVVAAITASWSDGSPFTGTLSFGTPYSNDNGTFAILDNSLIIDPAGPGVSADGDTTQNVTIVATQGDGSAAPLKGRR